VGLSVSAEGALKRRRVYTGIGKVAVGVTAWFRFTTFSGIWLSTQ